MPTIVIAPTNYRMRATQITQAEYFTDILNSASAAAQNAFKMAFDFEPPILAPELNDDAVPNTWYLAVPADQDAFDGALGYWEREAFSINSWQPASSLPCDEERVYLGKLRSKRRILGHALPPPPDRTRGLDRQLHFLDRALKESNAFIPHL